MVFWTLRVPCYQFPSDEIAFHPKGHYVVCDRVFSEVLEQKGNVWRCMTIEKELEHKIITDGKGHYAHGKTIDLGREDLYFKRNKR